MKISKLLENPTPSSTSDLNGGGFGGQAPRFGRDPEILEDEQIDETTAGSTGTGSVGGGVATDLGMQRRSKGSIFQGVRTSKKFVNSPVTEDPLKDKSLDALSQAKNVIAQKRMADLEQWEKEFKQSMANKLKQKPSFEPVPVSQPGEKHSVLKSRMSNLDMAIQKHQQVEALAQKLDKVGRLSPAIQSAIDTRMHIKLGPKDNYQTLNRKLDSIIEMLNKNLNTYKIARKKPKKMREDGITAGINKYYDDRASGALDPRTGQKQPYLQQWALKVNGKVDGSNIFRSEQAAMLARSALLRKNPNVQIGLVTRGGLAEADMNRRDFIKGVGAVAATGATDQAQPTQRQDLGNSFSTAVVEIGGVPFNVVLDTVSKSIYMLNQKSDGTPLVNKPGSFIVIRNGKLEPRMDLAPNIMNALQKAGLLDKQQGVREGVRDLGYDAQSLIMKLRRDVEERRLQPTREAVLSAARELAGDMDFAPELLVRQVLGQGVTEEFNGEYDDEAGMFKNNLQTIQRVSIAIASATLAGAALGAGNAQAADLGGYNTQYLQGVVSGQVARPMISVDAARQELQARANGKTQTQAPANTNVAPQQGTNQTPNLSAYETRYLQGVVLGKVPRPTVSVDAARQELQLRASSTQSDVNTISSRWGSNQPNNANVITSRGVQRESMNDNPKVDLSPNYPNYSKLIGEFIGVKKNRARFLIIDAELKPGVSETEKIFRARTTNTPISIEISKVRNRTVVEGELSEESLLAKELANQFKLFNKANDRDLSGKPEDREIIAKEAAHVPGMVDRIENQITTKIAKEHPEIIQQYGKQIVQDAISSIAVYHRHMREVTPANIDDMVNEIIQQLDRHLHMREDENS